MTIRLGNLSIDEIQKRTGVTFPDELIKYMNNRKQDNANDIKQGNWHCFDIPFQLVCGDVDTAKEIHRQLLPLSSQFKRQLSIAIDN